MKKYLLAGLLVWTPLAITVWVLSWLLGAMDSLFAWLLSAPQALLPTSAHASIEQLRRVPGLGVLAMGLGLLLGPIVAVRSDRHRGRWGRRIPYLFLPTPFIVVSLVGMAFTPDGSRLYVACELANTTFAIDWQARKVIAKIATGNYSNGVVMHPNGQRVYVSNGKDATVSVIDTSSNTVVATIPVGKRPWNMAITPDGKKVYVATGRSNAVSVIDTETNKKIADVPVGEAPWGVVIH